jgi:rhodanese-related sulfurtransferase
MQLYDQSTKSVSFCRDVTPQQVHDDQGRTRLVDVREPHEFNGELGHIPGAELVPLATVEQQAAGWDRAADLVVICRSGGRSSRAAEALARLGFSRVMNLVGGMLAHDAARLPVERG